MLVMAREPVLELSMLGMLVVCILCSNIFG